ncbi:MAG TPA: type II toxin-antitoxin system prevent-host-death family antitoxin [Acidimicrobiia bacterium]
MDVTISALRAHLADWLDCARSGEEVVVTDRGVPVARLVGLDSATVLERLGREGLISRPPGSPRPTAAGRRRVRSSGSVSDLVSAQRR